MSTTHRGDRLYTYSTSESAAAKYMNAEFQMEAKNIMNRTNTSNLKQLVVSANEIIKDFATHEKSRKIIDGKEIQLGLVMSSMLTFSKAAGGERGTRYVASRIVASHNDVEVLAAVGYTWLVHFLFIFRVGYSHYKKSESTNETLDDGQEQGPGYGAKSFKDNLFLRDAYTCVVSNIKDFGHPNKNSLMFGGADLESAHIIPRTIAIYEDDKRSGNNIAAIATLDILANFTHLTSTEGQIRDLSKGMDEPPNGMLLESNLHTTFTKFYWCFHRTGVDTYKIKLLDTSRISFVFLQLDLNIPVVFKDRSTELNNLSAHSLTRSLDGIPLPNPVFIAVHAAVAGILNMSGAGQFFDGLLHKYDNDSWSTPLMSWMDLETLIVAEQIQEALSSLSSNH